MSTKTTLKRISLVAVAAVGFGLLSAVPSFAASSSGTSVLSAATQTVGSTVATTVDTFGFTAGAISDTGTLTATLNIAGAPGSAKTAANITMVAGTAANGTAATVGQVTTLTAATAAIATVPVTVTFTPDVVGSYVITLTNSVAGDPARTFTITNAQTHSLALLIADGGTKNPDTMSGNGVAGVANTVTLQALGTAGIRTLVTVSGASSFISSATTATIATGGGSAVVPVGATLSTLVVNTPAAGTVVANSYLETGLNSGIYSTTADQTVTITVSGTALSGTFSAGNSSASLNASNGALVQSDATILAIKSAVSPTQVANIHLVLKDVLGVAYATANVSAVVTGAGLISGTNTAGVAKVATVTNTGGIANVGISADGLAGVGTINVYVGSVLFATKTVTFYGASTALTAANASSYIAPATSETSTVTVKDAAGNLVAGDVVTAASSNSAIASVVGLVPTSSAAGLSTFTVTGVSAGDATITFTNAAATATATVVVHVVGATPASVTMTTNQTQYAPGEKVILTVTALDSTGKPVADGTFPAFFGAAVSANSLLAGALPLASVSTVAGVATYVVYAPLISGEVTISGTLGTSVATAIQGTVVTAGFSVTGTSADAAVDAANAATDAANYAADAADAATTAAQEATAAATAAQDSADAATAAVVALGLRVNTLMASVRAQITSLSNLIVRIIKKIHA